MTTDYKPSDKPSNYISLVDASIEMRLAKKLDLMIERVVRKKPSKDALIVNEGAEGEGKTNASIVEAAYIRQSTKRDIHLFFRMEPMMKFAQDHEAKIIIWDEPSLDSLNTDQLNQLNKNMLRLFMTIRKKRHFFIINFTKFYKFPEYVVVDRSLALIHLYSRKEVEPGRFVYIKKKNLENLWNDYRSKKLRNYKKYRAFYGAFPEIMEDHFHKLNITVEGISNATLKDYELQKDEAIRSIGQNKDSIFRVRLVNLRSRVGKLKTPIKLRGDLAKQLGINIRTLEKWARGETNDEEDGKKEEKSIQNEPITRENEVLEDDLNPSIEFYGGSNEEKMPPTDVKDSKNPEKVYLKNKKPDFLPLLSNKISRI